MTDTYQATYDAVRSKISGGDIGAAVESVVRDAGIGDAALMVRRAIEQVVSQYENPSAIYRPKISIDGDMWCALYGDNLQDGVAGFGNSPAAAMSDFDANWYAKLTPKA